MTPEATRTQTTQAGQMRLELGRKWIPPDQAAALGVGTVVVLDCLVDGEVAVTVAGRALARGEPVVVGDRLGVRITETAAAGSQ